MTCPYPFAAEFLPMLLELKEGLEAAPHGAAGGIIEKYARLLNRPKQTLYRWLKTYTGYGTKRKRRSDAGSTACPEETLLFIAAAKKEDTRKNGKENMTLSGAMNLADANGLNVPVSKSRIGTLLRARKMDVRTQRAARTTGEMRSLHPNHWHQIDPSLCVVYYMRGRQFIARDEDFYKNKPANIERVALKVWRYVRYDHASGVLDAYYFEAAGESQTNLFEFLLWTWGRQEGRGNYGVPKMLLWDKGSANTAGGIRRMLDALGVNHQTHATEHPWAKGGVENGNNLIERHFESRLRFEPCNTVEELNAACSRFLRDWNANRIKYVDSRIRRASGEPMVRDELWAKILQFPGALVEMPERKVCEWFMHGAETTRQIRNLKISFAHPALERAGRYDLSEWAEFVSNGQTVEVAPLLLGEPGRLRVKIERLGFEPLHVEVSPEAEFDEFGRSVEAQVAGEGYLHVKTTAAQRAANLLAEVAWGEGVSAAGAEAARRENQKPFSHWNDGKGIVAHSHLGQTEEAATRLLPRPAQIETEAIAFARAAETAHAVKTMTHFEAASWLAARGVAMDSVKNGHIQELFPDGVPEAELEFLRNRLESLSTFTLIRRQA